MDKSISKVSLEIDGQMFPAIDVKPADETYRSTVQLMGRRTYIDNETEFGLDITFVESKIKAYTPDIRKMTAGKIAIVYDDGSREIRTGCVTLSRAKSGYSPNNGATLTYTVATDEPTES